MRLMLSNSSDYMLSPDIVVCPSMQDLYAEIDKIAKDDEILYIFVDNLFVSASILSQLEMFNYEFQDFRLILDKSQSLVIDLNSKLRREFYYITEVSNIATDLFINMGKYDGEYQILDRITDLERSLENKSVMKNLIEYDFLSLRTTLYSLIKGITMLIDSNKGLKKELEKTLKEKLNLIKTVDILQRRAEECDRNRSELLTQNLKLKYMTYMDTLNVENVTTTTPLVYIKCLVPKNENDIIEFFNILNGLLRNKYNSNSTLIVIDDYRTLPIKKTHDNFTYIFSQGTYNMANIGNKIITTSQYVGSLFENFEKFTGIKDLFLVLDLTSSTNSYVIGDGSYVVITNDSVKEDLYKDVQNIKCINENLIVNSFLGDDDFNIELNVSKSDIFKDFEKIALELM